MTKQAGLSPQMTIERAQMIAMRLADTANRMVKTGELSRFQVGRCSGIELPSRFYLREAIRDIITAENCLSSFQSRLRVSDKR